jgi:hypothetical protein
MIKYFTLRSYCFYEQFSIKSKTSYGNADISNSDAKTFFKAGQLLISALDAGLTKCYLAIYYSQLALPFEAK